MTIVAGEICLVFITVMSPFELLTVIETVH